jgi:hypothetical protein
MTPERVGYRDRGHLVFLEAATDATSVHSAEWWKDHVRSALRGNRYEVGDAFLIWDSIGSNAKSIPADTHQKVRAIVQAYYGLYGALWSLQVILTTPEEVDR